jgi:hypothetical protein
MHHLRVESLKTMYSAQQLDIQKITLKTQREINRMICENRGI